MDFFNSKHFDEHVRELMQEWHVPGLAIAIVQDQLIASKGFGKASLNPEKPYTSDTLLDVASSSKSLTAGSVGLLVTDEDRYPQIQWDTTVSSLLPDDFVMSGKGYTETMTVEDILSHRTGLPRHDLSYLSRRAAQPDTPRSLTRNIRNLEVVVPIRSKFLYNNIMYTVATYLIETLSGISFAEFLRERFFKPLGMTSTNVLPSGAIAAGLKDRIATPYAWKEKSQSFVPVELQEIPEAIGAGSIITSVNDYILWIKALMNQEHPVSEALYKGLMKPRMISSSSEDLEDLNELDPFTSPEMYGLAWEISYYRGYRIVRHDGGDPAIGSIIFFLPQFKFGGVMHGTSNDIHSVLDVVFHELIDEVLKVPEAERPDWLAIKREAEKKEEDEDSTQLDKIRERLCPGMSENQPQKLPLKTYVGQYWNVGYHGMTVEIKADELFVDASDRTMGFSLTFEHICDQTKFVAHSRDFYDGEEGMFAAEFRFENDRAVKLGVHLEDELEDMIWFDRVDGANSRPECGHTSAKIGAVVSMV